MLRRSSRVRMMSTSAAPPSRCTVLFGTQLWRSDLLADGEGTITSKTNLELGRAVRQAFARQAKPLSAGASAAYMHEGANHSHDGVDPIASAANNEFFQHQIDNLHTLDPATTAPLAGDDCMLSSFATGKTAGAFAQLSAIMRSSAARFFVESYALSPEEATGLVAGRRLLLWASVHAGGSAHPYHSHRDALVSGVYFVDCPEGAGSFIAGSAMPPGPLSVEYRVDPAAGTLLVFPSSLPHRVSPSTSEQSRPRVSISFNLEGRWDESPPAPHVQLEASSRSAAQPLAAHQRLVATLEPAERSSYALAAPATQRDSFVSQQPGTGAASNLDGAQVVPDSVAEDEAMKSFAQMAQKLMKNQDSKPGGGYGKRPQGMPERRKRR
jgi:hypothetical protein